MEMKSKLFSELTTRELYEILKARSEIFVVEQNCVYQDLDDRDYESLHVFFEENGKSEGKAVNCCRLSVITIKKDELWQGGVINPNICRRI